MHGMERNVNICFPYKKANNNENDIYIEILRMIIMYSGKPYMYTLIILIQYLCSVKKMSF